MKRRRRTGGSSPFPSGCACSGLDTALLWGNLGVSLLVLVGGGVPRPGAVAAAGARRDRRRRPDRQPDARRRRDDRRRRARSRDGADARAARAARLVPPDRAQRRAVPRLGDLRADHHRDGRGGALGRALRLRGAGPWTLVFGAVAAVLALLGPVGVVRRFLRRYALWIVLASLLYLTWWALDGADLARSGRRGEGGSWLGIDLVVALTVTWIPLAPTTRASPRPAPGRSSVPASATSSRRCGCSGSARCSCSRAGSATRWRCPRPSPRPGWRARSRCSPSRSTRPTRPSRTPTRQRSRSRTSCPACRSGRCGGRLRRRDDRRAHDRARELRGLPLMLGSFFVPLFGVLLADWLLGGTRYTPREIFGAPAFRPGLVAAWLVGFALYQWLLPTGPDWWVELVERPTPASWGSARRCRASWRSSSRPASSAGGAPGPGPCPLSAPARLVGSLAIDLVEGGPPQSAARPSTRPARCGCSSDRPGRDPLRRADRGRLVPPLAALGLPVTWLVGEARRRSRSATRATSGIRCRSHVGDPWSADEVRGCVRGALGRASGCTLGRCSAGSSTPRRWPSWLAGGGSPRRAGARAPAEPGPLMLDGDVDPALLEHVSILKLAEEEAVAAAGSLEPEALAALGPREVLVTFGSRGALVVVDGRPSGSRPPGRRPTRPEPATPSAPPTWRRARPGTHRSPRRGARPRWSGRSSAGTGT